VTRPQLTHYVQPFQLLMMGYHIAARQIQPAVGLMKKCCHNCKSANMRHRALLHHCTLPARSIGMLNERGAALAAQSSCAEAASFDLPAEVLGACIAELQRALEMALVKSQDNHSAAVFAEGGSIPLQSSE